MKDAILTFWQRLLHPRDTRRSQETRALYFAMTASAVAAVVALVFFVATGEAGVAIFGRGSVASMAILLATAVACGAYFAAIYHQDAHVSGGNWPRAHAVAVSGALALIHAFIIFLLTTIIFYVVDDAFKGLLLDPYASTVIVASVVGVAGYAMYLVGTRVSTVNISNALAVFLVTGVLISMITADDPYWWTLHLSSLGAGSGVSAIAFELTLAVGGAVVACLADFLARDFAQLQQRSDVYADVKVRIIRTLLVMIGVLLACVGIFEYDKYLYIHNGSASGMVVMFLILILGLRKLVPGVSYAFLGFSYILMLALVVCGVLYGFVGYLNLTAFEIVAFAIVFSWLIVFIRQIDAALRDTPSKHRKLV